MAKVTRTDRLAAARAAGLRGEDPGPAWLLDSNDPAVLDAYEQGLGEHHAASKGRSPLGAKPSNRRSSPKRTSRGPAHPDNPPPAPSEPPEPAQPSPMPVPPPESRGISGDPHDLAGVLVGVVAVAFLINVLHGTWQQWLRAKFLNKTTGTAAAAGSAPATSPQTPPAYTQTAPAAPNQGGS